MMLRLGLIYYGCCGLFILTNNHDEFTMRMLKRYVNMYLAGVFWYANAKLVGN